MNPIKGRSIAVESGRRAGLITAVALQGRWMKILQARSSPKGPPTLLAMKARQVSELSDQAFITTLKELVKTLPFPPEETVGLLPTGEMLTRYLTLPSEDPEELKAMALYQLEGMLPFSIPECVTSVKVLGPAGEATRVLVVATHRPNVERLIRICQGAGLTLTRIAASSEAIGIWHRACWPPQSPAEGPPVSRPEGPSAPGFPPEVWLTAELSSEGLDFGVLAKGSLVYMRQIPHRVESLEDLLAQLKETIQAYTRESVGPPVKQITLGGWLKGFGPSAPEILTGELGLPVHLVDPLEASPFRDTLSLIAQELTPEISFSELLGVAAAPRLLELDLLPLEARRQQAEKRLIQELRLTALLVVLSVAVVFGWMATHVGRTWWQLNQVEAEVRLAEPLAKKIQQKAAEVRSFRAAREEYALKVKRINQAVSGLVPGMFLSFLGLEADSTLVLRGTAPDLEAVTHYASALRKDPLWKEVALRSAKEKRLKGGAQVEFELVLKAK